MHHRRNLLLLPLALFVLQCRTAAPPPQPLRLIAITRSDDGEHLEVKLERLQSGTAFVDEHLHGFVATTPSNFEVALRLRHDTPLSRLYWEYGVYTDAAGVVHHSLTPMFQWDLTPARLSTDYTRFFFAPTEYATLIPHKGLEYGSAETRFQPFLANLPPNGRVQLQLPMDLDGKRYTYTFTFEAGA